MSSEIKADKWSPASGTSATIGDSGDTYTVPSGVTLNTSSATLTLPSTVISGQTAITSLADTDKFLVSDASDSGNLKHVEKQYLPGGDLVRLGTVATDNSNVSALTIDNCFSSTYDLYRVVGYHNATSGGAHQYVRWRTGGASGSSYTTSDYTWINRGYYLLPNNTSGAYYNNNASSDHGRVASDMRSDGDSAYVTFDLLVSDPNTNVMSRGQITGVSCVRQNTDQRWVSHHVGITNGANVNATGIQMTVSTGSISYGRVSVYGIKQA